MDENPNTRATDKANSTREDTSVNKVTINNQSAIITQTPKYQYYQDESWMKIQILEPNLTPETLTVPIAPTSLTVTAIKNGTSYTKEEKVLIKLKKVEGREWRALLDNKKKKNQQKQAVERDTSEAAGETLSNKKDATAPTKNNKQRAERSAVLLFITRPTPTPVPPVMYARDVSGGHFVSPAMISAAAAADVHGIDDEIPPNPEH
eukprot:CCRYP_008892-RA/>CCRYP_008892-RA protein AED:0.37 eAED:0.12 QI:0/0/0/1/1/1/2/0/205